MMKVTDWIRWARDVAVVDRNGEPLPNNDTVILALAQKCEELHKALKNLMDEVCCECGNGYWSQGTCGMNGCMYSKNVRELLGKHPVIEQPKKTFTNTQTVVPNQAWNRR